jgi:carboxymethylenebutenolidase
MGRVVEIAGPGAAGRGYLAEPASGRGLPVVVVQEAWGLGPQIEDVVDQFAVEGFTALAPDLQGGHPPAEPDAADELMMALNLDEAARRASTAVDMAAELAGRDRVGVTGFGMGGVLALALAARRPDRVVAVVPWYGAVPWAAVEPDWSPLAAKVLGHYAEKDHRVPPARVAALQHALDEQGKDATLHVVPGADHGYFDDTRPEAHDPEASRACWNETVTFLHNELG